MDIFAKSLAPILGYPESEVYGWLTAVFQQTAEDLILQGSVHIVGIGTLKRVHIPSEPLETSGQLSLSPPRYQVKLLDGVSAEGNLVYEVSVGQLQLSPEVAEKFTRGFSRVIEKVVDVRGSLQMGHLGEFLKGEKKALTFKQSEVLTLLLEKQFAGLSPVPISILNPSQTNEPRPSKNPPLNGVSSEPTQNVAVKESSPPESNGASLQPQNLNVSESELSQASVANAFKPNSAQLSETSKQSESAEPMMIVSANREPLFIALAAAAAAKPVAIEPPISYPRPEPLPPIQPSKEDEVQQQQPSFPAQGFDTNLIASPTVADADPAQTFLPNSDFSAAETPSDPANSIETFEPSLSPKAESPVLRNIIIATLFVIAVLAGAFILTNYESGDLVINPTVEQKDRAQVEAEKAAAARAEAERVIAEKSIPRSPVFRAKQDSIAKANLAKLRAQLPPELQKVGSIKGSYTLIVASRPTKEDAEVIAKEFEEKGLAVSVIEKKVGGTIRYRVYIGDFKTAAIASKIKRKYPDLIPSDSFPEKIKN